MRLTSHDFQTAAHQAQGLRHDLDNATRSAEKLHKDHIANTFLFTSKVLDQYKRMSDAHAEVLHGMLRDFSVTSALNGNDPTALAQEAMTLITKGFANQSGRSGNFINETAAAYAEIMRLVVQYGTDSFVGAQSVSRSATDTASLQPQSLQNAWMAPFMSAFQNAANMMTANMGSLATLQPASNNAANVADIKPATGGKSAK